MVDDIWKQVEPLFKKPGPAGLCSDSELLTMALVGECREWDKETTMLSQWKEQRALFPHIPSPSGFNRRRRALLSLPQRNQLQQLPHALQRATNAVRQIIETVNAQLTEQFNLQLNHAHTFNGFCTRLLTKLTAILCVFISIAYLAKRTSCKSRP